MSVEVNVREEEEEQMREELANEAPWVGKPLWLVKNSSIDDSISGIRELCWNGKYICTEESKEYLSKAITLILDFSSCTYTPNKTVFSLKGDGHSCC